MNYINFQHLKKYDVEKKYFDRFDAWLNNYQDSPKWLSEKEIANIVAKKSKSYQENTITSLLIALCQTIFTCSLETHVVHKIHLSKELQRNILL